MSLLNPRKHNKNTKPSGSKSNLKQHTSRGWGPDKGRWENKYPIYHWHMDGGLGGYCSVGSRVSFNRRGGGKKLITIVFISTLLIEPTLCRKIYEQLSNDHMLESKMAQGRNWWVGREFSCVPRRDPSRSQPSFLSKGRTEHYTGDTVRDTIRDPYLTPRSESGQETCRTWPRDVECKLKIVVILSYLRPLLVFGL